MRVKSKTISEATQITEEMVLNPYLLPTGIAFGSRSVSAPDKDGKRHLISYTLRAETARSGDYGPEFVHIGQWYVTNENLSEILDDIEFKGQYEEC